MALLTHSVFKWFDFTTLVLLQPTRRLYSLFFSSSYDLIQKIIFIAGHKIQYRSALKLTGSNAICWLTKFFLKFSHSKTYQVNQSISVFTSCCLVRTRSRMPPSCTVSTLLSRSRSLSSDSLALFTLTIDKNTFWASLPLLWTSSHRQDSGTHLEKSREAFTDSSSKCQPHSCTAGQSLRFFRLFCFLIWEVHALWKSFNIWCSNIQLINNGINICYRTCQLRGLYSKAKVTVFHYVDRPLAGK